jgi:hypothetical protein
MKNPPTLADAVLRESFRKGSPVGSPCLSIRWWGQRWGRIRKTAKSPYFLGRCMFIAITSSIRVASRRLLEKPTISMVAQGAQRIAFSPFSTLPDAAGGEKGGEGI